MKRRLKKIFNLDILSDGATRWIGSTTSIIVHTVFFIGVFTLRIFGVSVDSILLILTTLVSLEAIYLSIFIQRSVNKQSEVIEDVEEALDETEAEHGLIPEQTVSRLEKPLDELVEEIRQDIKELLQEYKFSKSETGGELSSDQPKQA